MRPSNYAHERWPDVSVRIHCLKERKRGRHWRQHEHARGVCLTKAQAELYDRLLEYREDNTIDIVGNNIKINTRSLLVLIDKHKLFSIKNGILTILK